MEQFQQEVQQVCQVYEDAMKLAEQGVHVLSTDEKTGIQAIAHDHPSKPMKPGQVERVEHNYTRHGTTGLIASRDVVSGKVIAPLIQPTRKEEDFVEHVRQVVAQDPDASYLFIMDQLNTHKSESLVQFIAGQLRIDEAILGEKGKSGILQNMETRKAFLEDEHHRIRIVYTPKHCSWLNQIECWFSVLGRRLLNKRSSFSSVKELETLIRQFIDYYNQHLAKAFQWTYKGKLLKI